MEYTYVLRHHGVKGMKWGIRRYQNADGSLTPAGRKRVDQLADKEIKKSRRQDSKNRRLMTNDELKTKIGRLEQEKRLRDLTESEVSAGRTAASRFLRDVGTEVAKNVTTSVLTGAAKYAIRWAMTGEFKWDDAANYVVPKPKK